MFCCGRATVIPEVEPIRGQDPPANPIVPALVTPPLSAPKVVRLPSGACSVFHLIQKARTAGEYVLCEKNEVTAMSRGVKTSIAKSITIHQPEGKFLIKVKKYMMNEAASKADGDARAEKHPVYFIYKKYVKDLSEIADEAGKIGSNFKTGGFAAGMAAVGNLAASAASAALSAVDLDSPDDIIASVIRVEGESGTPGATWQMFEGKIDSAGLDNEPRPPVLYEYFEDVDKANWMIRNGKRVLVGKGEVDWTWRPPPDVATVPASGKFASMKLELGSGVDIVLAMAGIVAIDDFDDKIYDGKSTDAIVEFGQSVTNIKARINAVLNG
eukprot:CAMPEP_0206055814 /NCGR_PEP_ID=MMETSP1466-20131121/40864_1 /ASSEMBLY_ACC=CAM_ASM_001126 /TAXON_ID=44452 /ORGANISM="Pavlova gyrans, Strain CCMP608" /LENGTH=326 /DNA_ID=CAMNT_0053431047 /DNA_START=41 /DNA_END=1021 /DNA_ORIENTATION=-